MSLIKNIAKISVSKAINTAINFLFLPFMARSLSYEDYGTYGQVLLIVTLFSTVFSFGLHQIIYIYLNRLKFKIRLFSSNIILLFFLSLIAYLLIIIFSGYIGYCFNNENIISYLWIYGFSMLFGLPYHSVNSFLIFLGKVKESALILVFGNVLKVGLIILSIQYYKSLNLVFISIVISNLFQLAVSFLLVKDYFRLIFPIKLMKQQLKSGFPMGLTNAVGIFFIYTDSVMVSSYLGLKEYAIYRNGAMEIPFISTIYLSISAIIMPEVANLIANKNFSSLVNLKKKVVNQSAMIIYPIMVFLLFYSKDFIEIYIGEMYSDSSLIFFVYCFLLLIRINDYQDILISADKTKIILYTVICALLLNLVLNHILIKEIGSIGAAISSIFSYYALAFTQLYISFKKIGYKVKEIFNFKPMFILLLFCVFIISIFKSFLDHITDLSEVLSMLIIGLLYFPIIYFILFKLNLLPVKIINILLPNPLKLK